MKRLVYSPQVNAYVRSDYGLIDLSDYIVSGNVSRKLDQVSTAEIVIRNPNRKWTDFEYTDSVSGERLIGPVFHPMDPITIIMTRLQNKPIQVFTGFLDKTPYLQMRPGTVSLVASCTLKKLQYTYFDAGLPFVHEFLTQEGWEVVEGTGIVNLKSPALAKDKGDLNDSGFGKLLYSVMRDMANWDDSTIFIEEIPDGLIQNVTALFEEGAQESEEANKFITNLLHKIIGTASLGEGLPGGESNPTVSSPVDGTLSGHSNLTAAKVRFCQQLASLTGLSLRVIGAWVAYENGPDDNPLNIGPGNSYGSVQNGVKATNKLLHESLYSGIMATVGKSDQEQMAAIAASPWCPECPGYLQTLEDVYSLIKVSSKTQKTKA